MIKSDKRVVWTMALFCAAVTGVMVTGASAARPGNGPIRCPEIWAPVICSNGVTYPNQCYADRAHASGCRPTGDI